MAIPKIPRNLSTRSYRDRWPGPFPVDLCTLGVLLSPGCFGEVPVLRWDKVCQWPGPFGFTLASSRTGREGDSVPEPLLCWEDFMGGVEGLCLGTEEGGPRVLLPYRFGPSKTGFLSSVENCL